MKVFFAFFVFALSAAFASEASNEGEWGKLFGYAKSVYVFDDRKGVKLDQKTFGAGGKIGYETPSLHGIKARAAYYTTDDLGTNSKNKKQIDAYMFDVDKTPYSVLGEAQLEYKNGDTTMLFGRQEIDTPIVSTYDYRIIPNLFEAYTVTNGSLADTTLVFSYITKMSGLDGLLSFKKFLSMSQQTYTSLALDDSGRVDSDGGTTIDPSTVSGDKGLFMLGFLYGKNPSLRVYEYYCKDISNTLYADALYEKRLSKTVGLESEVQWYEVKTVGKFDRFLRGLGLEGSYRLYGFSQTFLYEPLGIKFVGAFNAFGGNKKTVTAFGNWGGYPELVSFPYMFAQGSGVSALAKARGYKAGIKLNPKKLGLPGELLSFSRSFIDLHDSIMPQSDNRILTLLYKAKLRKNLSFKALYEIRDSKNYRYDNDMLTLSLRYDF